MSSDEGPPRIKVSVEALVALKPRRTPSREGARIDEAYKCIKLVVEHVASRAAAEAPRLIPRIDPGWGLIAFKCNSTGGAIAAAEYILGRHGCYYC